MVRGKAGSDVEFGSKIGICVHNGLTYLDHLSWNSYNETEDLKTSSENYKKRNGYYPEKINADQIYITRENRKWCKERNILLNGKPLGRPTEQTKERIKELRKAGGERNCVEGKFGQAKRWYGMGNIHAKLNTTSESMIGWKFRSLRPLLFGISRPLKILDDFRLKAIICSIFKRSEKENARGQFLAIKWGLGARNFQNGLSRGFNHYITLVTDRLLTFKCLRKSYLTYLVMALGDKAKLFSGHSSDEVLKKHYLSSAHIAGGLNDFRLF